MRALLLGVTMAGAAWGAAAPAALTPGQALLLQGRAIDPATALRLTAAVYGPWHRETDRAADQAGEWHYGRKEWAKEADCRRVMAEARRVLYGEDHWRVIDARALLADALAQPRLTDAQRDRLRRSSVLHARAILLFRDGRPAEALALEREAAEACKAYLGERHRHYGAVMNNLALMMREAGEHVAALPIFEKALAAREAALGGNHPDVAQTLNNMGGLLVRLGRHDEALPLYQRAMKIERAALGRLSRSRATTVNNLAVLHYERGEYEASLRLHLEALAIYRAAVGVRHPDYAHALNNLAVLHKSAGDHGKALPLFKQALAIREAVLRRGHPDTALSLHGLGGLYREAGDYVAALPLLRRALEVRRASLGERHPYTADSLNELASLYQAMGDHAAALPLFRRALSVTRSAFGEKHPDMAVRLHNVGGALNLMGDPEAARPLYERALEVTRATLGEKHPHYAHGLQALASLHDKLDDGDKALALTRRAAEIYKAALGEGTEYAGVLNNMAGMRKRIGDPEGALEMYWRVWAILQRTTGEAHPLRDFTLSNLASIYRSMNRPGAALPLAEQGLARMRRRLSLDASVQSERQQRAAALEMRRGINLRLTIPDEAAHFSHSHVIAWKGSAFAAQQARRRFLVAEADADTRALALDLREATRSLGLLSSRGDAPSRARAEEALRRKEDLEGRLAGLSAPFRLTFRPPTGEGLRGMLPPGVALVDYLVHKAPEAGPGGWERTWWPRLSAWVARAGRPTVRLDLGPMGPVERDVQAWRAAVEAGRDAGVIPARLRRALWAPVEAHLVGASVVVVSPDGGLGRLPFAALPGKKEGGYLIEDVALAVLPVPQTLGTLLGRAAGPPSLLALGGVEYGEGRPWGALAATGREADAVADQFRRRYGASAASLSGGGATRAAVREALPRHRYAHLATHGFFAPAAMRPAEEVREGAYGRGGVTGWDPGLLSGVVLAGANSPTADDDGLLKASEVAEMDLSGVELAVLSACQTGLGQEAGGEGMLGLQRAFAVAGCRSVVSSLWSVDDAATSVLMERFYLHLWQKKLPKLEALRQAQLDVMKNPAWVGARVKALGLRGVRSLGEAVDVVVSGRKERRSPVAWWGAWQLSGGWR